MQMVQFDEGNGVLVDNQGIMLTKADVEWLARACIAHLRHSDLELVALGRGYVEHNHPRMVNQFNFDMYP